MFCFPISLMRCEDKLTLPLEPVREIHLPPKFPQPLSQSPRKCQEAVQVGSLAERTGNWLKPFPVCIPIPESGPACLISLLWLECAAPAVLIPSPLFDEPSDKGDSPSGSCDPTPWRTDSCACQCPGLARRQPPLPFPRLHGQPRPALPGQELSDWTLLMFAQKFSI